jgi:hypothetical protein
LETDLSGIFPRSDTTIVRQAATFATMQSSMASRHPSVIQIDLPETVTGTSRAKRPKA